MLKRLIWLCAVLLVPRDASAQIRASELASVSQTIDGTKITITYSRPRARGRPRLFGDTMVVTWNEVWTPGANYATTLETSKPIKLDGHPVPAGKYSMWMIVRESGNWTVLLDTGAVRFHTRRPDTTLTAVRYPTRVKTGPFTEVLTWSFPEVRSNGGTMALQWGTVHVPIDVMVEPSVNPATPIGEASPYVGRYAYSQSDTTKGRNTKSRDFTITLRGDTLQAEWDKKDVGDDMQNQIAYFKRFALLRISPDSFVPGIYDDRGEIYEVLKPGMVFQFKREGDRITGFEVRNGRDKLQATATRKE